MTNKLKPLKDDKDLAAVPLDEPVLVELEPADAGGEVDEPEIEPRRREPKTPERERREPESDAVALERQLLASQEAERLSRERADAAERKAEAAIEERDQFKAANADTEKELLANSLTSAQAEEQAARAAYKTAFDAGDADAMADASAKIGRAAARVVNFEGAIAAADNEPKVAAKEPAERTERDEPKVDIVTAIDRDPKLMSTERDWLKSHTEVLTDPKINRKLAVAYDEALEGGLKRGTPAYFQFLEEKLGYSERRDNDVDNDRSEDRASVVAAPVSRESRSSVTGQRLTPTQVRLTPEQRDMARLAGVTDAEYARGVMQMQADRRANPEKYAQR